MEECLGVNARPVVRVACNLEERECESLVGCNFLYISLYNAFYGRHLISVMDEHSTKDEINVPMALSVFRDGDRSPRSGGKWDLSNHC